jgi:peptidoglycan/xylan/chitin deacetylase (PgdA/CDA1 family)
MQSNFATKAALFCSMAFLLFSCKKEENKPKPIVPNNAGVVLTFDDAYVTEWGEMDKEMQSYSWKATFCVSNINTLTLSEINKLHTLQNKGHEIAGHSVDHRNATTFVAQYGIDKYLHQEINPMLDLMDFYGLKVTAFAYPYGSRSAKTDTALLKKFKILRGTVYSTKKPNQHDFYFNHSKVVYGFGMDTNYDYFSIPHVLKLLDYAKKNNKILILVGHKPVKKITARYQTKIKTVALICKYIRQNHMKFYTLSELYDLK